MQQLLHAPVHEVALEQFWYHSRYQSIISGCDFWTPVQQCLRNFVAKGGFFTPLLVEDNFGNVKGSMLVFHDPQYRSAGDPDVACFGLVTVQNSFYLSKMIDEARQIVREIGFSRLRGPINPPRYLFGYGVQISGFSYQNLAGSSINEPYHAGIYQELKNGGVFSDEDQYFNLVQSWDHTFDYIDKIELNRDFIFKNPPLDDNRKMRSLVDQLSAIMNDNLDYRPDYCHATAETLLEIGKAYKDLPSGDKLVGLLYDDDVLAGAVIMQPDWFQVLKGEKMTRLIGDTYLLDKKYQGRRLFMNFSEYSKKIIEDFKIQYYEHSSVHESAKAILSTLKTGVTRISKSYSVFEVQLG